MVRIEWSQTAVADLSRLDAVVVKRIIHKIKWFADNFSLMTPEQLSGEMRGLYKIRVGDWRVIYTLEENAMVIHYINHRSRIYKEKNKTIKTCYKKSK